MVEMVVVVEIDSYYFCMEMVVVVVGMEGQTAHNSSCMVVVVAVVMAE